VKTSKKKMA